ncbi:MAG: EamA family transporter [Anaerolineae bacterium]
MLGVIYALAQALCMASTTIILRSLSHRLDIALINGLRAGMGLLFVVPAVLITGGLTNLQGLTLESVVYLVGSVIAAGVVGDALYVHSLRVLGVGRTFPIASTYPLFTVLAGVVFLHDEVGWSMAGGLALVLAGVYLVARPSGHVSGPEALPLSRRKLGLGLLFALGTSILWGVSAIFLSLGVQEVSGAAANMIRVPVVMVLSLAIAARNRQLGSIRHLNRASLLMLLVGGVVGWGVASTFYIMAIQTIGPSKATIIGATAPMFAVPLSALLLRERPTRYTLAGTLLTTLGIALVV